LSKLLGKTNLEGQVREIELTQSFLKKQIEDAEQERQKNEKLYKTLGMTIGLAIVILLA
jgi:stage III sporulation protein AB